MIRELAFNEPVDFLALFLCIVMLVQSLPGFGGASIYLSGLFYLIVPGYAFMRAFLPDVPLLDGIMMTVGLSLAVSAFATALAEVLSKMVLMSTIFNLNALSAILLAYAIMRDRRNRSR